MGCRGLGRSDGCRNDFDRGRGIRHRQGPRSARQSDDLRAVLEELTTVYLNFYGLREKPFNTTPDPRFLFLTASHREALSQLTYGVREGTGFAVLAGPIGTGKTTLLQTLLQRLDSQTAVAMIVNPSVDFDGLLELILDDFGIGKEAGTTAQRMVALNRFLLEQAAAGRQTLLVIDEAQQLEPTTLERIRLISNYESPTHKLLQIILAGQPE